MSGVEIIIGVILGSVVNELGHHNHTYHPPQPRYETWCQLEHTGKYLQEYDPVGGQVYYVPEEKKVCYKKKVW